METLKAAKTEDGTKTSIFRINPKDRPVIELYGEANPDTGDWVDGLLSKIYRKINDNRIKIKDEEKWIVFDGDMDAKWIEDMNSDGRLQIADTLGIRQNHAATSLQTGTRVRGLGIQF